MEKHTHTHTHTQKGRDEAKRLNQGRQQDEARCLAQPPILFRHMISMGIGACFCCCNQLKKGASNPVSSHNFVKVSYVPRFR